MRRDGESGKAEKSKNRVLCTLRSEGARDFSLWFCVQAARVARAARESGAMHPPIPKAL